MRKVNFTNGSKVQKTTRAKIGLSVLIITMATTFLSGCGDDSYRNTLESGLQKYNSGDTMTKSEYNAVKSYNNWKSNQGEKSYSDWDN